MRSERDPRPYLHDILDCIQYILLYTRDIDVDGFLGNRMMQDAVVRRIEVIGEAVNRLPDSLKGLYPDIPWQDIKEMRNKLIHDYGCVDLELVWVVVRKDITALEEQVRRVLDEVQPQELNET